MSEVLSGDLPEDYSPGNSLSTLRKWYEGVREEPGCVGMLSFKTNQWLTRGQSDINKGNKVKMKGDGFMDVMMVSWIYINVKLIEVYVLTMCILLHVIIYY